MSEPLSKRYNAFFMAKEVALSLDDESRKKFVSDFLEEEARERYARGANEEDILASLETDARLVGAEFSRTELRRIVGKVASWGRTRYLGQEAERNATLALIQSLKREVASWRDEDAFSFGIPALDEAFGRLYPGEVLVVVGAQGAMKTSLLLTGLERYLRTTRGSVMFFSLDMKPEEITERRLMRAMGVGVYGVRDHVRRNSDPFKDAAKRLNELDADRFIVLGNKTASRFTAETACQKITSVMPEVVAIDYLTLLRKDRQTDMDCVNEAMPMLKAIAQEYGIMMVILSQMGRDAKKSQEGGFFYGSAKGGGIVEELANAQIDVFKDAPVNEFSLPRIIATVSKTRRGVSGKHFELEYDGSTMSFTSKATPVKRLKAQKQMFASSVGEWL